jgi:hypothetical protein
MLDSLIGLGKDLGLRFNLVGLFPSAALAVFVVALVWGGAPEEAPSFDRFLEQAESMEAWEGALLFFGLLAVSLLAEPLQLSLVRLLEGYWSGSRVGRPIAALGVWWHGRCRRKLERLQMSFGTEVISPATDARMREAAAQLQQLYPPEPFVMPTKLGNVLRSAEIRAGRRYGLDAIAAWPRLYPLLSEKVAAIVDDQRNQLDIAARFCVVLLTAALVYFALLATHAWWLVLPAALLVLAYLSYRAAVAAAVGYGKAIEVAFDLHRFDMLAALHLPLPADSESERASNEVLSQFLRDGLPHDFRFAHGELPATGEVSDTGEMADASTGRG